jgi:hypothetical protein
MFEPAYSYWNNILRLERPDLCSASNPWDRITDIDSVRRLIRNGVTPITAKIEVLEEHATQSLKTPDDWWTVALGSGLRWAIDQLDPPTFQKIRQANIQFVK